MVDATKSEPMAIRPDLPPSRIRRHQPRGGATDPTQVHPGSKSAPEPDRAFDLSSDFGEIRPGGEFACRVLLSEAGRCGAVFVGACYSGAIWTEVAWVEHNGFGV